MNSNYSWPYQWRSMASRRPIISPLIHAIINNDIRALKQLRSEGMTLCDSDEGTLQRVLFEKMESHDLMKLLIEDEYITSFESADYSFHHAKYLRNCIDENGYSWGLMTRAYYVGDYELMDLLARYGFDSLLWVINRIEYNFISTIFYREDLKALRILYENGWIRDELFRSGEPAPFSKYRLEYPDSIVSRYLNENPYPKRRSMGLDHTVFTTIKPPYQEKLGFLHRKEQKVRNEYRILNYQDRLRAQKEYLSWLQNVGKLERWQSYVRANRDLSLFENDVAKMILKN